MDQIYEIDSKLSYSHWDFK